MNTEQGPAVASAIKHDPMQAFSLFQNVSPNPSAMARHKEEVSGTPNNLMTDDHKILTCVIGSDACFWTHMLRDLMWGFCAYTCFMTICTTVSCCGVSSAQLWPSLPSPAAELALEFEITSTSAFGGPSMVFSGHWRTRPMAFRKHSIK